MRIGTKSLLFGAHLWFWHPLVVAVAWWKLYGFPWDPRLWVAFLVHDWGYWGCEQIDGPDGDNHPYAGAKIMHFLFDGYQDSDYLVYPNDLFERRRSFYWHDFCVNHSRFLAKKNGDQPSRLCMADKLAIVIEPAWLYLPRTRLSGELEEFMNSGDVGGKHHHMGLSQASPVEWHRSMQQYLAKYVAEHKDGQLDAVTAEPSDPYSGV